MINILFSFLILVIGYFFGCFSTGYFIGKLNGTDIRVKGSGNTGTTNALRTMGVKGGILTFIGDLLKAFIPMIAVKYIFSRRMGFDADVTYLFTLLAGLGVVLGHNFPFYLHFKGGKGIAVTAAVIIISTMNLKIILIGLAIFLLIVGISRYVSLGSLFVVWIIPFFSVLHFNSSKYFAVIMTVSLFYTILAYIKHAGNIKRLIYGTERKLFQDKENE